MTFGVPLFLLATLAAAIPVLLHLIHKQKAREVPFSTLRFLKVSVQRTRKRKYIEDVALLSLRVAALLLIAVGLAKPTATSLKLLWSEGSSTGAVIILDNSASMALVDAGEPRFETARREAGKILDLLGERDPVALLLTGGPAILGQGTLSQEHDRVRQALAQCQVSYERADLAERLRRARALLADADVPNKEIYVLTDNQSVSWQGLEKEQAPEETGELPRIVVVNINRDPMPNVALQTIRTSSAALAVGIPVQVTVAVHNASPVPQQKHLELHVNGDRKEVSPTLNLAPGATLEHTFHFAPERSGVHRGMVLLAGEDGSALDDRLFFTLPVDQQLRVAIVKPSRHEIPYTEETYYLERALSPSRGSGDGWGIQAITLTPDQLESEPLADQDVVFCVNLPPLPRASAQRLRAYVEAGGHLFWICGANVQPSGYNLLNQQAGGVLIPAPLEDLQELASGQEATRHINFLDPDHPALAPLTKPASLYRSVLVYKHFPVRWDSQSQARVLARLDNGQPLLVQRSVGAGSVLMLTTAMRPDWTNLPLKPLFLPLVARLTFYLGGADANRSQVLAGAPLAIPFSPGQVEEATECEVTRPSGEVQRVQAKKGEHTLRYAETHQVGIYLFSVPAGERTKNLPYAVNIDPGECEATDLTRVEVENRLLGQPVLFCDDPKDLAGTIRKLREGESLWGWFLWAVLLGLVLETWLANRFRRQTIPDLDHGSSHSP
jgi:hypothetical protein